MMGVGTLAIEAKVAGRPSVGVDLDPLAAFIAKVKTTVISPRKLSEAGSRLLAALRPHRRQSPEIQRRMHHDLSESEFERAIRGLDVPAFPNSTHWFRRYVTVDLAITRREIRNLFSEEDSLREFFMACLAASIRRVSNADPTPVSGLEVTKHMRALIKRGYEIDVFGEFERRLKLNTERMAALYDTVKRNATEETPTLFLNLDVSNIAEEWESRDLNAPALAMTSPPYCNAIEYWRRHRLEYLWLDLMTWEEVRDFSRNFIGSTTINGADLPKEIPPEVDTPQLRRVVKHLEKLDKERKASHVIAYFARSARYIQQMREVLAPGGRFLIVVGNSRTNGVLIPTSEILLNVGIKNGFGIAGAFHYRIKDRIMQYPAAGAGVIPREWVLILERK
jgi:hypothetical protein